MSLKLTGRPDWTFTRSITLTRKTNDKGVAVFPVGRICESLIQGTKSNLITYAITASEYNHTGPALYAVPGFADREILLEWGDGENISQFYPAAPCIVVYPNAGFEQSLFFRNKRASFSCLRPPRQQQRNTSDIRHFLPSSRLIRQNPI